VVLNSNGKKPFKNSSSHSERAPAKPGLQARSAAVKILAAVVDKKLPLDGALDHENGNPAYKALGENDRALVRAILNSALRHMPRIDAAIPLRKKMESGGWSGTGPAMGLPSRARTGTWFDSVQVRRQPPGNKLTLLRRESPPRLLAPDGSLTARGVFFAAPAV